MLKYDKFIPLSYFYSMKHLVIIGMVIPEPNSTAAGKRMLQLIDFFSQANYRISFLTAAGNVEFSFNLKELNINLFPIEINSPIFETILQGLQPDVVLYDRFVTEEQFGWKVAEICPNAIKILDTEDLHFLRKARENAYKKGLNLNEIDFQNEVFIREMASIYRSDLSLIISEFEYDLLIHTLKVSPDILLYIPLFAEVTPDSVSFINRKNFVSIGNFLHEPNWQTVLKLKQIWLQIKKQIPEAEIHIYGAYITEKAKQLHNEKQGFWVKGRANSVEEVFNNARVLLAPIPFGAGIKGKLLDSMRLGLPNITTKIGAEAMHGNLPWNGFVVEDDESFVEKAINLYNNQDLWYQCQKQGYDLVENRYKKEQFYPIFEEKIQSISTKLKAHRMRNYFGKILLHHTLQSSKYLGKWIEEKQKNRE